MRVCVCVCVCDVDLVQFFKSLIDVNAVESEYPS